MTKRLSIALLCLALAGAAAAQQTTYQVAFNAVTAGSGTFGPVRDINQTTHWATCVAPYGSTTPVTVSIVALVGSGYVSISRIGQINQTTTQVNLQASGYYPWVGILYSGLSGGAMTCVYGGATGAVALPQNVGLVSPTSQIVTSQPAGFATTTLQKSAAVKIIDGTNGVLSVLSLYAINPNAAVVYVTLTPAAVSAPTSAHIVLSVPANSAASYPVPITGLQVGPGDVYAQCSTSLSSLVDPASNCFIETTFKALTGVAPN